MQIFAWQFLRFSCTTFHDFSSDFSTLLFLISEGSLFLHSEVKHVAYKNLTSAQQKEGTDGQFESASGE